MSSLCDRTGFPLVQIPGLGVSMHLFPVVKPQFEPFLAEPNRFGDTWYEEVLKCNPRISPSRFTPENRERLFLTGVLSDEAEAFAEWQGTEWFIPTADLWRRIYVGLSKIQLTQSFLDSLPKEEMSGMAVTIVRTVLKHIRPKTIRDFSFMSGGVIEWVRDGDIWGGLGNPRSDFAHTLCNPLQGKPVHPVDAQQRVPYFGFRLFRASSEETRHSPSLTTEELCF